MINGGKSTKISETNSIINFIIEFLRYSPFEGPEYYSQ